MATIINLEEKEMQKIHLEIGGHVRPSLPYAVEMFYHYRGKPGVMLSTHDLYVYSASLTNGDADDGDFKIRCRREQQRLKRAGVIKNPVRGYWALV